MNKIQIKDLYGLSFCLCQSLDNLVLLMKILKVWSHALDAYYFIQFNSVSDP